MSKLSYGFLAGAVAGIIKNTLDLFIYYGIGFQHQRYLDHASSIMLAKPVENLVQTVFFLFVDILFSGFLGIIFLLLIPYFKNNHYLFRGWLYSSALWFLFHSFFSMGRVPMFYQMMFETLVLHFVIDSIYGLTLGYLVHRREK